jgi:hypothetical protein
MHNIFRSKVVVNRLQERQQIDYGLLPTQDKRFFLFSDVYRPTLKAHPVSSTMDIKGSFSGHKGMTHLLLTPKLTMPELHLHSHTPSRCRLH